RILHVAEHGDDPFGVLRLPALERRGQEFVAVGEVPVEAALGDAERARQRLDGGGLEPAALDRRQRRPLPIRSLEPAVTGAGSSLFRHPRLIPYACVLTN